MATAPVFDYVDEFPSSWEDLLASLHESGNRSVNIPVRWGAHESAPGIRDVSRSPRLRLEKLFQTLQNLGLRATLELGFSPHAEMFPAWTRSLKEMSTIPSRVLHPDASKFGLLQLNDVYDPAFIEPFWSFVDEVISLVNLYRVPDGPVEEVVFEPGVFAASFPGESSKVWENYLQQRYQNVSRLNVVYGTTFKDFTPAGSRLGTASLAEKRPWICAYDYHGYLETLLADLKWASQRHGLQIRATSLSHKQANWTLLVDSVFTVSYGASLLPVSPLGGATDVGARSFLMGEEAIQLAHEKQFPIQLVRPHHPFDVPKSSLVVTLMGKYICRAHYTTILEALENGSEFLFLFGLPQYDEDLNSLTWPKRSKAREELFLATVGRGKLWVREFAKSGHPDLWREVETNVRLARNV